METTFIYALNDPETGECRYVGKADDPHDRLFGYNGHLYEARTTKKPCHRTNWISSLLNRGLAPLLEILQEVPKTDWKLWERVWIKTSREIGMDLVNGTPGGDGVGSGKQHPLFGKSPTLVTRSKMSAGHIGKKRGPHSLVARQKISAALLGKKHTPQHRAAIVAGMLAHFRSKEKLNFPNE